MYLKKPISELRSEFNIDKNEALMVNKTPYDLYK